MLTAATSDLPAVVLFGGFSDNLPPILFLALIVVCGLMIVAGAVFDMMGDRVSEPKVRVSDEAAEGKKAAKAEKAKAKAEAKARQKAEKAEKAAAAKAAKAAKPTKTKEKKGKSKAAAEKTETAAAEEPEAEFTEEPADFTEAPEHEPSASPAAAEESAVEFGNPIDFTEDEFESKS